MIDKMDKIDYSFVVKDKSWFKEPSRGIDVESINGITFKDLFGEPMFSWSKDSIATTMDSVGFDTFDRGVTVEVPISEMTKPNKNKTSYVKDVITKALKNSQKYTVSDIDYGKADVTINGHSLTETAKKVDGLDMVTNDMWNEVKDLETRIKLLECRFHDAECGRMNIKSLIDDFCKEMFAGVSYNENTKKIEFWNYNKESLGGIILK